MVLPVFLLPAPPLVILLTLTSSASNIPISDVSRMNTSHVAVRDPRLLSLESSARPDPSSLDRHFPTSRSRRWTRFQIQYYSCPQPVMRTCKRKMLSYSHIAKTISLLHCPSDPLQVEDPWRRGEKKISSNRNPVSRHGAITRQSNIHTCQICERRHRTTKIFYRRPGGVGKTIQACRQDEDNHRFKMQIRGSRKQITTSPWNLQKTASPRTSTIPQRRPRIYREEEDDRHFS